MTRTTRNSKNSINLTDETEDETNKTLTLQDVVDQMKLSIDHLELKIDDNSAKVTNSLKSSGGELDIIEKNTTDLSLRVEELEREVSSRDVFIDKLSKKIDELEQDKTTGTRQDKNDNLRRKLDELFSELELPYDSEWVDLAYRVGFKSDQSKRPRAVKISFPFLRYRPLLFKNTYKLRNSQKFSRVYLVDDYSPEVQEYVKELRAISAFARSKGIDSRSPSIYYINQLKSQN